METLLELLRDPAWEGIAALIAIFVIIIPLFIKTIKFLLSKKITLVILAGTFLTTLLWFIWPIIYFDEIVDNFKFPSKIQYDIFVNDHKEASFEFSVSSKKTLLGLGSPMYQLSFGNVRGSDFTSIDNIYTVVFKDTLSLSWSVLMRGKEKIFEMKANKAQGIFEKKISDIFVYQKENLKGPIETEPYTLHKLIDFLSLFLVASESVANGKKGPQNFHFFVKGSTEVVQLAQVGKDFISYQGQMIPTTIVVLTYQGREIFKLHIYRDKDGFYFPIRFIFDSSEDMPIEFRTTKNPGVFLPGPSLYTRIKQFKQSNHDRINKQIGQKFKPSQPPGPIYVTYLTFMDADTKMIMVPDIAKLINKAVVDGMQLAKNSNPQLKINQSGYKLENTDANANKLIDIFWDVNLSKGEKIQKIITEMMVPNQIDAILAGQYLEKKGDLINVRPFVISKAKKSIVSRNHIFDKKQFLCTDPQNQSVKVLCQGAHEKIREQVKELLETL